MEFVWKASSEFHHSSKNLSFLPIHNSRAALHEIPPAYCRGWPSFVCSLAFLAALTALVVDVAQQIGCITGVRDSVIANTVLALGTSIPGGVSIAHAERNGNGDG